HQVKRLCCGCHGPKRGNSRAGFARHHRIEAPKTGRAPPAASVCLPRSAERCESLAMVRTTCRFLTREGGGSANDPPGPSPRTSRKRRVTQTRHASPPLPCPDRQKTYDDEPGQAFRVKFFIVRFGEYGRSIS